MKLRDAETPWRGLFQWNGHSVHWKNVFPPYFSVNLKNETPILWKDALRDCNNLNWSFPSPCPLFRKEIPTSQQTPPLCPFLCGSSPLWLWYIFILRSSSSFSCSLSLSPLPHNGEQLWHQAEFWRPSSSEFAKAEDSSRVAEGRAGR